MTEQSNNNAAGGNPGNNSPNRRNNNRRRYNNNRPRDNAGAPGQGPTNAPRDPQKSHPAQNSNQRPQGQPNPNNGANAQQKRRPPQHNHQNNRPRPQGQPNHNNNSGGAFNIERVYEKYLNLLDQHIIARRKYHDLFYRADPAQKNKLERNFYNTLNDIREFESRIAPDVKILFEKRNNGYQYDRTYTSNHEIPIEGDVVPQDIAPAEPHLLQSQIAADYSGDVEESVGTAEDYLKYKNF